VLVSHPAPSHDSLQVDADHDSRPASSTSSLDPYYFGAQSPSDSPPHDSALLSVTPETRTHSDSSPLTPARDPANIDRNGLVGVGELATPRWDRLLRRPQQNSADDDDNALDVLQEQDSAEVAVSNVEPDGPDSPWTIEAVDGEFDDQDQVRFFFWPLGHVLTFASSVTSNP
jgi:dual specificity tyrosine-phosphorylation-regulated kinase 2/3/4